MVKVCALLPLIVLSLRPLLVHDERRRLTRQLVEEQVVAGASS
jgi:hypothetical protein